MRRLSLLAIILWMLLVMNEENREDIYVCVCVCVCVYYNDAFYGSRKNRENFKFS